MSLAKQFIISNIDKTDNLLFVDKVTALGVREVSTGKHSTKRFVVLLKVQWSNGNESYCARDHDEMFRYHRWTVETYPDEAGFREYPRIIPKFPERAVFKRNNIDEAAKRLPKYALYFTRLMRLACVKDNAQSQAFFLLKPGDPLSHKEAMNLMKSSNCLHCGSQPSFASRRASRQSSSASSTSSKFGYEDEGIMDTSFEEVVELFY